MITPTIRLDSASQRELDRYLKKLDKNRGKPLLTRAENTTYAAARLLVPPLRAAIHKGRGTETRRGGNLARRVHQRRLKKRSGEDIRPTWIGSSAFYARFYAEGTAGHQLYRAGGLVRFTTRSGENVSFTMKEGARSAYARFPDGEVRSLVGMEHPGARPQPFIDAGARPHLPDVYALIARDVFDIK